MEMGGTCVLASCSMAAGIRTEGLGGDTARPMLVVLAERASWGLVPARKGGIGPRPEPRKPDESAVVSWTSALSDMVLVVKEPETYLIQSRLQGGPRYLLRTPRVGLRVNDDRAWEKEPVAHTVQ